MVTIGMNEVWMEHSLIHLYRQSIGKAVGRVIYDSIIDIPVCTFLFLVGLLTVMSFPGTLGNPHV